MNPHPHGASRREFIRTGAGALLGAALAPVTPLLGGESVRNTRVAIVPCRTYGAELRTAFDRGFDLLGGIGNLVTGKTVTVKLNLTGSKFQDLLGRPVGETYVTHPATVMALTSALFGAGARRVRLVESMAVAQPFERTLTLAGIELKTLFALGKVEIEDTRNRGNSADYATLKVPGAGHLFSEFELNRAYEDTDVFVSLCKLKTHGTTGVTLTMKNLFGITPNSLYGDDAPSEEGVRGRGRLHNLQKGFSTNAIAGRFEPPGARPDFYQPRDSGYRVPRIITDLCAARPIHLGIIDGITTLNYAEGPWVKGPERRIAKPGVIVCGLNPVATDAVGTALMGFRDIRAPRGKAPFGPGDNHLVLAERAGLGPCDLSRIDVAGIPIEQARSSEFPSIAG